MQFLAFLHLLLTCSLVLLLAYLLSRIFSHVASSLILGSGKARRASDGSGKAITDCDVSSGSRSRKLERQILEEDRVMTRLQEEDEENEYEDAETRTSPGIAAKYEVGNSIFDDVVALEDELNRDGLDQSATWNRGDCVDDARLATDRGGGSSAEQNEYKDSEDEMVWEMNKQGPAAEGGGEGEGEGEGDHTSRVIEELKEGKGIIHQGEGHHTSRVTEELKEEEEEQKKGGDNSLKLGDAQGSSSLQQRLPPTWADLERIVNISSKTLASPPSVPRLDE